MSRNKIAISVALALVFAIVIYLVFGPKQDGALPECTYGPTDAVLNEPCERGQFNP